MKIIGVTGGIGAGKSGVLSYLGQKYQAYIIQADQAAHEVMKKDTACYKQIVGCFGQGVVNAEGELDRNVLSSIVFQDKKKLTALNQMVHPAVESEIREQIDNNSDKRFIAIEAALLIEAGYASICDQLWYIYAEETTRRMRLKEQRGYSDEKITNILKEQLSDGQFRIHCSQVINNNGPWPETERQIDKLINEMMERGK